MEIIIAWELKKMYREDDFMEMIEDFYNKYQDYLDYPTIDIYTKECLNHSIPDETDKDAYWEYLVDEFEVFLHQHDDLYSIIII